jgi:DNA-binding transcriptional ArsR family regulator
MRNNVDTAAGTVIEALADPVRRQVVTLLSGGPRRAGQLAGEVGMSPPAMSRHLRVLLAAGVIEDERLDEDARARVFRLRPQSLVAVQSWLDQIQAGWAEQLAAYKRHVEPAGLCQQENEEGQ